MLLGRRRFKPCLGPGYFLLQLSDCMLETCIGWVKGPSALVTSVKAIRFGVGFYKKNSNKCHSDFLPMIKDSNLNQLLK